MIDIESIRTFVTHTQEWQGFGWNILTFGTALAAGTVALQSWGLSKQIATSSSPQGTSVVSVTNKSIAAAYYVTVFTYGLAIGGLVLCAGLVLGALQFVIAAQLWRIKGFTLQEWCVVAGCIGIAVAAFITPWQAQLFFLTAFILLPPGLAMQSVEMWRAKSRRGLAPQDSLASLITCAIWIVYGAALGSWLVALSSVLYAALYGSTLFLWYKYREQ